MLVEYGQLRKDDTVSPEDRSEQLVEIVSVLLRRSVPGDSLHLYDLEGAPAVGFEFERRNYLLSLAGHDGPPWDRLARPYRTQCTRRPVGGAVPDRSAGEREAVRQVSNRGAVLDRTHLEAAVAGLCPLAELARGTCRRRQPYVPLADLLGTGEPAPEERGMTPPARLTSPCRVETETWVGATAEVPLVGQAQQDRPTGLACLPQDRVLITCADGLLEVDAACGQAHWINGRDHPHLARDPIE